MASAYPLSYTLRWMWYSMRPSTRNRARMAPEPRARDFETAEDPLRVVFFGDLMVTKDGRVPSVASAVREIIEGADLVVGNCEASVGAQSLCKTLVFTMSDDYVGDFLEALGVRVQDCILSVANNHTGDGGPGSVAETIRRLKSLAITTVGEQGIVKCSRRDVTLGFAAWSQWFNNEVEGIWRAEDVVGQPWQELKEKEAIDCLIATPHWEWEFKHFPMARTRALGARFLDDGVDLIVGHHPHVLQPLMMWNGKPCLFSTGNLNGPYFWWLGWPASLACLFEVRIVREGSNRGRIAGYTLHPLVQEQRGKRTHIARLEDTRPDLKEKYAERLAMLFTEPQP